MMERARAAAEGPLSLTDLSADIGGEGQQRFLLRAREKVQRVSSDAKGP